MKHKCKCLEKICEDIKKNRLFVDSVWPVRHEGMRFGFRLSNGRNKVSAKIHYEMLKFKYCPFCGKNEILQDM